MIEISISRELADAHPGFMAHCADRGHAISVFDSDEARSPTSRDRPSVPRRYLAGDHAARGRWAIERRAAQDRTD